MKNSKKTVKGILVGALALAMGITVLFAGAGKSYAAGEASLNKKSFNILTRRTFDLDVANAPKDAVITWKSSNPAVAVVDDFGVVTGITKGEAKIICEVTAAGKTQKLTATARVRKPAVKIEIINKIEELEWGKEYDLNRNLTPGRSNDVTTWTSSDETIATVDNDGVVEALADGTVIITATTMSGKTDSVEITVYGEPEPTEAPEPTPVPGEEKPDVTKAPKPTAAPKATATPKPTKAPKPAASKTIYADSFEKGVGKFVGHGAQVSVKKSASAADGVQFLQVSGRSAHWQGARVDMETMLKLGGTYKLTAFIKQNASDSEVLKASFCKNGGSYGQIDTITAAKNEWTEVSGEFTIDADTTSYFIYFEADNLIDFMVDKVTITEVKAGTKFIVEPLDLSKAITYDATKLKTFAWNDGAIEAAGDAMKITYTGQYGQAFLSLPQAMTIGDFSEIIINMSSTLPVGIKLMNQTEEVVFWWNKGTPDLTDVSLSYQKTHYSENVPIEGDVLTKKFDAIGFMVYDKDKPADCVTMIKSISLIPKK